MIPPVQWLSEKIEWERTNDPDFTYKIVDFYTKFKFKNIVAEIGDYILISNADADDPDTVEGCDIGQIVKLYQSHDKDLSDRYRAHVQWFCKSQDVPANSLKNTNITLEKQFEIVEDHRPFDKDVSIETFFKKCEIIKLPTTAATEEMAKSFSSNVAKFLCRYRIVSISKRKVAFEPVLEEERKEYFHNHNLKTPQSKKRQTAPKTPNSLVKKFSSTSIHEKDEWVIKKIDSSKLTLMRDITNNYQTTPTRVHKHLLEGDSDEYFSRQRENAETAEDFSEILPGNNLSFTGTPKKKFQVDVDFAKRKGSSTVISLKYYADDTLIKNRSPRTPKQNKRYISDEIETPKLSSKSKDKICKDESVGCSPPKRSKYKNDAESDEDFILSTPKKDKSAIKTIKIKRSVIKSGLTPTISARKVPVQIQEGALQIARECLHVSAVPLSLPCREEEFNNIYTFIENKIVNNIGGCMYISGVPGTGKTATVTEAIRCLKKQARLDEIPQFEFIEINGMRLTEPRQAYVQIYKQLTGKTVAWEQAHNLLEARFTKPAPRRSTIVLLVDELDVLCNRRQDVLYNLLDWPSKSVARLVVVAIANTMDLPERLLMGRVASRLGLTRLTFQPYTYTQLQNIVTARLSDTGAFNSDAVQLVSRKVAAVSGDARRALDICRRAVELAEMNEKSSGITSQVTLLHVNQALTEMIASPKVQAIKSCSKMEQLFLQATAAEIQRTGIEETIFHFIYKQLETICAFVGSKVPSITETLGVCCRLGSSRLIISDHSRNDIYQKVLLNVSSDDVHYATQRLLH